MLNLLPDTALRLLRRFILFYGRRLDPNRMLERSRQRALQMAAQAARTSQAYRTLLREHGLDPTRIGTQTVQTTLPVLSKTNTFERFSLDELSRAFHPQDLADVLTSSGRGSSTFGFRLSARDQHETSWFDIDLGLQDAFGIDQKPTLLVNCLPMGVIFHSRASTVANVSVREDMACAILRNVGPSFRQTLLCTDPLFIRRLLDEADRTGVDWKALNTSVIMGEEVLVESQREYIAARTGIDLDQDTERMIGSTYGTAETGLNILFETRETIKIRRSIRSHSDLVSFFTDTRGDASIPSLFCFNPLRCYIEVLNPDAAGFGELCFTMLDPRAVIPLPRYATGDLGKLIDSTDAAHIAAKASSSMPWLPMVAVKGRIKDRSDGLPSVESIKELLYQDHAVANRLTGAFRLSLDERGHAKLTLQTASESAASDQQLHAQIADMFSKLHRAPTSLVLLAPDAFPWRPMLDYERKFSYYAS